MTTDEKKQVYIDKITTRLSGKSLETLRKYIRYNDKFRLIMKELSIEQKAKRFDEAIERAKSKIKNDKDHVLYEDDIIEIFPELAESEDERIRKELVQFFKEKDEEDFEEWVPKAKVLAWLEKQGEQILANSAKTCKDEQKPSDKVEPKFHEGEWLCENEPNNYARFIQILEIVNVQGKERYRISRDIHNDEDIVEFDFVEKYYHKFDIQDAKDGDVLVMQKTDVTYESIFIFKKIENDCIIQYLHYFITDAGEKVCEARSIDGFLGFVGTTVHPSTKEQRDTLEKAMTDAGCKFDFDKKELKKIVVPKFNVHDCVIKKHNSNINDFGSFTITDITGGKYWYNNRIICDIAEQDEWEIYEPVRQKPAEWSEEDEQNLNEALSYIKDDALKEFIKSLRPQKQWKPSDEQMKVLLSEVKAWTKGCPKQIVLESLYNDLKKLREQ